MSVRKITLQRNNEFGPGFGEVGSISNYAGLSSFLKFTSMAEMLIGRLEIFPILYLIRSVRLR